MNQKTLERLIDYNDTMDKFYEINDIRFSLLKFGTNTSKLMRFYLLIITLFFILITSPFILFDLWKQSRLKKISREYAVEMSNAYRTRNIRNYGNKE